MIKHITSTHRQKLLLHIFGEDGYQQLLQKGATLKLSEAEARATFEEILFVVLQTLNAREQRIVELCYGLIDNNKMKHKNVATLFGIKADRVRQIKVRAVQKLQCPSRTRYFHEFLDIGLRDAKKSIEIGDMTLEEVIAVPPNASSFRYHNPGVQKISVLREKTTTQMLKLRGVGPKVLRILQQRLRQVGVNVNWLAG
jgi:hypothetical protein